MTYNIVYNQKILNIFKLYENSIPDSDKERIKFHDFFEIYSFIETYNENVIDKIKKAQEVINNSIKVKKARKELEERRELSRKIIDMRYKLIELENKFNN